jgi:hypothetical protein
MGLMVGGPPKCAVPICSWVVRLDLGMINPTGGNRDGPPEVLLLISKLSGWPGTQVARCSALPYLRILLESDSSFLCWCGLWPQASANLCGGRVRWLPELLPPTTVSRTWLKRPMPTAQK